MHQKQERILNDITQKDRKEIQETRVEMNLSKAYLTGRLRLLVLISHQFIPRCVFFGWPHINTNALLAIGIIIEDERNRICSMLGLIAPPSLSSFARFGEGSNITPSAPEFDALHM